VPVWFLHIAHREVCADLHLTVEWLLWAHGHVLSCCVLFLVGSALLSLWLPRIPHERVSPATCGQLLADGAAQTLSY
jgi:hypothetical protein